MPSIVWAAVVSIPLISFCIRKCGRQIFAIRASFLFGFAIERERDMGGFTHKATGNWTDYLASKLLTIVVVAGVLLSLFPARILAAITIDVGFNTENTPVVTGAAAVGAVGDFWNAAIGTSKPTGTTGQLATLNDTSNHLAPGVSLSWSAPGSAGVEDETNSKNSNLTSSGLTAGKSGGPYNTGNPGTITISGLEPLTTYSLYVYTVYPGTSPYPVSVTVNGFARGTQVSDGAFNTAAWVGTPGIGNMGNYLLFLASPGNAAGIMTISFDNAADGQSHPGAVDGFQIVGTVPEPSSVGVAVIGLVSLGARRLRSSFR
jgi:hypothetical protein